jgi:hypothetical protein
VIRLALDGLWMADLFGLAPPQGALREQVMATLERMASGKNATALSSKAAQDK